MPTRGKASYSIQSVENALNVLEALCEAGDEVRVSHLSERLGMNKTSVFRLLATFEKRGYVERETGSGAYRLGLSAYEMGQKFLSRMGVLRQAKPVMELLARECGEAAYLAVRRGAEVLFFDMTDTIHQIKIVSLVGRRYPLATTAAGKVILAHSANAAETPPAGYVPAADELAAVARQGASVDQGALGEGIACAAVPLFRADGEPVGSLCFIGPDFRLNPEKIERLLPRLKEGGDVISSKLGHHPAHYGC